MLSVLLKRVGVCRVYVHLSVHLLFLFLSFCLKVTRCLFCVFVSVSRQQHHHQPAKPLGLLIGAPGGALWSSCVFEMRRASLWDRLDTNDSAQNVQFAEKQNYTKC